VKCRKHPREYNAGDPKSDENEFNALEPAIVFSDRPERLAEPDKIVRRVVGHDSTWSDYSATEIQTEGFQGFPLQTSRGDFGRVRYSGNDVRWRTRFSFYLAKDSEMRVNSRSSLKTSPTSSLRITARRGRAYFRALGASSVTAGKKVQASAALAALNITSTAAKAAHIASGAIDDERNLPTGELNNAQVALLADVLEEA
jgi:hypothetical protein